MKGLYAGLIILVLAACGTSPEQLTATSVVAQAQTQTALPTPTSTLTPTPTSTPQPTFTLTSTSIPTDTPEPSPVPVGETIQFNSLEITLLSVENHSHIAPGGFYYYYAKPGYVFVELRVLVRNTGSASIEMSMSNIYVVEEGGQKWFASFGTSKTVEVGKLFNPVNIKLSDTANTGNERITFEKDTYLRLIFYVKDKQSLLFGIQNSPRFTFNVNKK